VAGVDGAALGGVHGRGVGQRQVCGHVAGRELQRRTQLLHLGSLDPTVGADIGAGGAAGDGGDGEPAVGTQGGDAIGLAVDRRTGVARVAGEFPAVAAGLHEVADSGRYALPTGAGERDARLLDHAERHQLGA
jgi:hypothetical protein